MSLPKPHEQSYQALFYRHGIIAHRHAALLCLVRPLLRASGKDKTMKIPKTPIEFDYDLWTTEDGKCMVRIKLTGEVTEVDREIMKILRSEEKRLRRLLPSRKPDNEDCQQSAVLSIDALPDGDVKESYWLTDPSDFTNEIMINMMEKDFIKTLTPREREVFVFCMRNGREQHEYAAFSGLSISRVCKIVSSVRKKAKNFFI